MESDVADPKPAPGTALSCFKPPPDPSTLRRRKVKVLEEDEYVENVSKIIERDFFPELEKLKAQSEYIEAKDRRDDATVQRLEARYSGRRPTPGKLKRLESPATFETPQEEPRDGEDSREEKEKQEPVVTKVAEEDAKNEDSSKVSLDKFLANHTSEDNESFHELMEDSHKEFCQNHAWMFKEDEQLSIEQKSKQLALPSPEEQMENAASGKSKGRLDGWTYKNVNSVFYNPDGVEFSREEKIEMAKKERQIVKDNTRFTTNPWKSELQTESVLKTSLSKREANSGKVGADGKEIVEREGTPSIKGYKLLRIEDASPMVNPEESPLMTWGEVESTPYRLEGCETPLVSSRGGGPSFTMQEVPKRDRLALELAEKNSKFHRDKKGKALQKARSNIKTPNRGSLTGRVSAMSPAAQRLASSKLGIRLGTDKVLSAAYTPSPGGASRRSSSSTPRISTSVTKAKISSSVRLGNATPKTPRTPSESLSITDNLLNLPSSSPSPAKARSNAAEFF